MTWSTRPWRCLPVPLLLLSIGCGSPPPPVMPAPEPEPEAEAPPEPAAVPQIPLEERIRAPFAVQSDGQMAVRTPRREVVVLESAPLPTAPAGARGAAARDTTVPDAAARDTAAVTTTTGAEVESGPEPVPAARPEPSPTARPAPERPAPPRPADAPRRQGSPREHTVEVGETFFGIARFYSVTPAALAALNPGLDSERLRAGQTLRLPAYATWPADEPRGRAPSSARPAEPARTPSQPARTAPAPTAGQDERARRTHRVQAGETLWSISRRYGVTPAQVRAANRMTDDTVRIGETLVIP
jgi:membrane-bound lytic murein transglycosylase D